MTDSVTGSSCSQPTEVMQLWQNHFGELLNRPCNVDWEAVHSVTQQLNKMYMADMQSLGEVRQALSQLRSGKTAGEHAVPAELLKHGGAPLDALLNLLKVIWETEQVPERASLKR